MGRQADRAGMARHALVLGGARSGKTRLGLHWAQALGARRLYLATAEAWDDEMAQRIARHQAERDETWRTQEVPQDLPAAIAGAGTEDVDVVLVDCLTLWLSNLMHAGRDPETEAETLISALALASVPVILVSNEVGMGLVPETPLGRSFRDAQGRLNQRVSAAVGHAVFVAAGLPLALKGARPPQD